MKCSSYPKIYNLGHKAIQDVFKDTVFVQEKVDGSQFRALFEHGMLHCFSKRTELNLVDPPKLFRGACQTFQSLADAGLLNEGWVYCGEALETPRHNHLEYARVPRGNVIIFDIMNGVDTEDYFTPMEVEEYLEPLGLEMVPTFFIGQVEDLNHIKEDFLKRTSILGKAIVEGVVFKNYARFGLDGKPLFAKLVREEFKETQQKQWKKDNPKQGDVLQQIIMTLKTDARWDKAIQHLRDDGKLENSPRDIGLLIKEIQDDTMGEEADWIKEKLFKWAEGQIRRAIVGGFPEYYKEKLAKSQFED